MRGSAPPSHLTLSVVNRIDELGANMDAAEAFLDAWAIGPENRAEIMVILDEVAANIIHAAWPGGGQHHFSIELQIEAQPPTSLHFVLLATDDGIAFDPTEAEPPDITLDLDEREPGGLGLFMVREMSDSVEYSRCEGQNRLRVTKRLQRPQTVA